MSTLLLEHARHRHLEEFLRQEAAASPPPKPQKRLRECRPTIEARRSAEAEAEALHRSVIAQRLLPALKIAIKCQGRLLGVESIPDPRAEFITNYNAARENADGAYAVIYEGEGDMSIYELIDAGMVLGRTFSKKKAIAAYRARRKQFPSADIKIMKRTVPTVDYRELEVEEEQTILEHHLNALNRRSPK